MNINIKIILHKIKKNHIRNKNKGQTLIEFILLLAFMSILSTVFLRGSNTSIGGIWREMIETITENSAQMR